jgi:hypothetical protein
MLGFDPDEQACIAALVFELVCQALEQETSVRLGFAIERDRLVIAPIGSRLQCGVEKRLPPRDAAVGCEDLAWVVRELAVLAPTNGFEEVRKQNQELLRAHLELRDCQARLTEIPRKQVGPTAA